MGKKSGFILKGVDKPYDGLAIFLRFCYINSNECVFFRGKALYQWLMIMTI